MMVTNVKYGLFASGAMSSKLTPKQIERLNSILKKIADAYEDDPGVSDLNDEQPAHSVTDLNLGDIRLARTLTR
jgi:hypothetical protein